MAQHDYVIANGTGAAVRSDLNAGLAAIVSQNSGATAPSTTYAYQPWADTSAGVMKMRNGANNAWITLYQLDGEWSTIAFENGTAAAPSIYFKDSGTDTGIYSPGADQVGISTAGIGRITVDASGNVNIDSNTLYVDAANNRVGVGTSSPATLLEAKSTTTNSARLRVTGTGTTAGNFRGFEFGDGSIFKGGFLQDESTDLVSIFTPIAGQAVNITSAGNVGIGTTSPVARLDVLAAAASTVIHATDGTNADLFLDFPSSTITRFVSEFGAGGQFVFANGTGKTERMRIDASGRLGIGTTASNTNGGILQLSGGITFPATAVAASDPNTLDDYEEGTWTPTQGGGLTVVGTFSSAGHYTKVGRQVTVQGYVESTTTVAAAANAIICGGLPFNVMNVTGSHFVGSGSNANLSALINVWANQASTSIYAVTSMAATTSIWFTVSYFTT